MASGDPQKSVTTTSTLRAKPSAGYHPPLGQTLVYGAEWRIFNAGMATLRVEQAGPEARVLASADAAGAVALLYHVHDTYESFVDSSSLCSRIISKHVEEGRRRVDTTVAFDYQRRKAILDQKNLVKKDSRHEEHDIGDCVSDVISAIFYAASLPLEPGKSYSVPVNDGGQTVNMNVQVEAHEQIKTPAGTFNTIRVQPTSDSDLLKKKGKIWVWYSDDAARIPVQMRGRMFWGTLTFSLQRIDKR